MISADRMKSVRIAPDVIWRSRVLPDGRGGRGVGVMSTKPAHYLLGALVAEVGGAQHQDRCHQPRHELTEQQRGRQDEQQLVAQGADRDPLDHRQLAVGGDAVHVLRRHRGVVDDDARRLGGRAPGRSADVVDRGGRQPGQRGNVVEESEQTQRSSRPRHGNEPTRPGSDRGPSGWQPASRPATAPCCGGWCARPAGWTGPSTGCRAG